MAFIWSFWGTTGVTGVVGAEVFTCGTTGVENGVVWGDTGVGIGAPVGVGKNGVLDTGEIGVVGVAGFWPNRPPNGFLNPWKRLPKDPKGLGC